MVVTKSTLFPLIIWSECFYSLRNFEKYNTVFLTIVNMCMLCPRVGSSHNWKFVPSEHLHPFPLDVSSLLFFRWNRKRSCENAGEELLKIWEQNWLSDVGEEEGGWAGKLSRIAGQVIPEMIMRARIFIFARGMERRGRKCF